MRRLLLLCCICLLAGCVGLAGLEKPKVALADLELKEIGLFEQHFLVTLRVSNPNNRAVTIDCVEFSLDLNGEKFASGVGSDKVTLPRMGDARVKLTVATNLGRMLKQLHALQSLKKPFSYHITGRLYAPWIPGGMPFDNTGELPALNDIFPELPVNETKPVERL